MESLGADDSLDIDLEDDVLDESIEEDALALQEKMEAQNGKTAQPSSSNRPVSFRNPYNNL